MTQIHIANNLDIKRFIESEDLDTPQEIALKQWRDYYAQLVGPVLVRAYPSVQWRVTIRVAKDGALAYIQVPRISGSYGMVVKIPEHALIPEIEKKVLLTGGELLERFNVRRARGATDDLAALPRNVMGEVIGAEKGEVAIHKKKLTAGVPTALRDIDARDLT